MAISWIIINRMGRHIFKHQASGPNDRTFPDFYSPQYYRISAYDNIFSYHRGRSVVSGSLAETNMMFNKNVIFYYSMGMDNSAQAFMVERDIFPIFAVTGISHL